MERFTFTPSFVDSRVFEPKDNKAQEKMTSSVSFITGTDYLSPQNIKFCKPLFLQALMATPFGVKINVVVNPDKRCCYDPDTSSIVIQPERTDSSKKSQEDNAESLSTLCHELSHARDHLVLRTVDTDTVADCRGGVQELDKFKKVYKTEFKAWMVEALQSKLSKTTSMRMSHLIKSIEGGYVGALTDKNNLIRIRILAYAKDMDLPETWGPEKIVEKTKLAEPLKAGMNLVNSINNQDSSDPIEVTTPEQAQKVITMLDTIFDV